MSTAEWASAMISKGQKHKLKLNRKFMKREEEIKNQRWVKKEWRQAELANSRVPILTKLKVIMVGLNRRITDPCSVQVKEILPLNIFNRETAKFSYWWIKWTQGLNSFGKSSIPTFKVARKLSTSSALQSKPKKF
jgi:DNA relaxase NicK